MRLEKLYPGVMQEHISDYVPACTAQGTWEGVTFENALDMATGHYQSVESDADENAAVDQDFFLVEGNRTRLHAVPAPYSARSAVGLPYIRHVLAWCRHASLPRGT